MSYPHATPAHNGYAIGNWVVGDAIQRGTGDRLHGVINEGLVTGITHVAGLVIRCSEQSGTGFDKGLGLYINYQEEFDPPQEWIQVRSIIGEEERTSEWHLHPGHRSLYSTTPEETALWLLENFNETVYFTAEASDQPARYNNFHLAGLEEALWQALPCDESKFRDASVTPTPVPLTAYQVIDVDQIQKEPQRFLGQRVVLYANVFQFDSNTGPCAFLARIADEYSEDRLDYSVLSFFIHADGHSIECPEFGGIDNGDFVQIWAIANGVTGTYLRFLTEAISLIEKG